MITQKQFIEKWKVNKSHLASKLSMSKMTFLNRYKDPTIEDEWKLRAVFEEMKRDLEQLYPQGVIKVPDTEFNLSEESKQTSLKTLNGREYSIGFKFVKEALQKPDANNDMYSEELADKLAAEIVRKALLRSADQIEQHFKENK